MVESVVLTAVTETDYKTFSEAFTGDRILPKGHIMAGKVEYMYVKDP